MQIRNGTKVGRVSYGQYGFELFTGQNRIVSLFVWYIDILIYTPQLYPQASTQPSTILLFSATMHYKSDRLPKLNIDSPASSTSAKNMRRRSVI